MSSERKIRSAAGFTLIEVVITMLVLGFVLVSFAGVFLLYQRGSSQAGEYVEVQQNGRVAIDHITDYLRQAGSQTDYFRGQRPIVFAGPFQVGMNADIDNGRTIDGNAPLRAINRALNPNTVPHAGTTLYVPGADFDSEAETVFFTLDSTKDGVIDGSDHGDDPEENGNNNNLFVLNMDVYGFDGARNVMRESNVAIVRGPNLAPTWRIPQPLFQYWYDHDEDPTTDDVLWGDGNGNGIIEDGEALAVTAMPQNQLHLIRKIRTTVTSESDKYDKRYETNGGFLDVTLQSEVYVRNATRTSGMVMGRVYHDVDKDQVIDPNETGINGVEIRITGQSRSVLTDSYGFYFMPLPAGNYTITEIDPPGYVSTSSNTVTISLVSGQTKAVNFGDRSTNPTGVIHGYVYDDEDLDAVKDVGEAGIEGVLVSLDTGQETVTNAGGYFAFIADQGTYNVVETDPQNFTSTTPNSASATIAAQDDTIRIDFGDYDGVVTGTIEGYVFLDYNENGIRDVGEEGLPNVRMEVSSGDTTQTNASGFYTFNLTPDVYWIEETDPAGYTSTTINRYENIQITADTVVVRNFGDLLEERQDFVEIHISNTDRVLSISTTDLGEDGYSDKDIVLGTAIATGIGNMLVFHNDWESSTTPVYELFDTIPSFRRDAGDNITTMTTFDYSGDGIRDVLTGLDNSTGANILIWPADGSGEMSVIPGWKYQTGGVNEVMDSGLADFDGDGNVDIVVGFRSPFGTVGGFETFRGSGGGSFTSWQYVDAAGPGDIYKLGEIWAVDTGDVDGDGDADIAVGSHTGPYDGFIDIYENTGYATGVFSWRSRYMSYGAVNAIMMLDMNEDDQRDPDIVAGITRADNYGYIILMLNWAGTYGVPDTTGAAFPPDTEPRWPDDYVIGPGEVLSLSTLKVNNDIFPDIVYGTRSSSLYQGNIYVLPAYGTLPENGTRINTTSLGEVIAIDAADFNKDGRPDIVIGTRFSATQGRLVAYFGREL